MNDQRYKYILYTIVLVIVVTIGIQVYWNFKNYQINKQQLINDVQVSLDKAVDDYYADLAQKTTLGFSFNGKGHKEVFKQGGKFRKLLSTIDESEGSFKNLDSISINFIDDITVLRGLKADSMMKHYTERHKPVSLDSIKATLRNTKQVRDSSDISNLEMLTSKIVISITNDTLNLKKIDGNLKSELSRKNISVDYQLNYKQPEYSFNTSNNLIIVKTDTTDLGNGTLLNVLSKSSFLPKESELSIDFTNETKVVLKRMLGGISISTLLVLAVISCLFYLLKIIKHQKQLAEVKNDLISNITHEFKTPIATIGVALESINNFNGIDDKEKTKKYINMSSEQLNKLNIMVEKLLETATLDSDSLELNKDQIDIVDLLNTLSNRYKIQYPEKEFQTNFRADSLMASVDVFHFENALNNIFDNAVKYGGNIIFIDLILKKDLFHINISDNGNSLSKDNKERIFEKFYRVTEGNTHNVKGFGIGLYYTKTIIEKHEGIISLEIEHNLTTFKISLPNG